MRERNAMLHIDIACAEHGFVINCQNRHRNGPIWVVVDPENPEERYQLEQTYYGDRVWYKYRDTKPNDDQEFDGRYEWYWYEQHQAWRRYVKDTETIPF